GEIRAEIRGIRGQGRRRGGHAGGVISSCLSPRSDACGTCLPGVASTAPSAKLHPHQESAFPPLRGIQHRLGLIPRIIARTISRTSAATQSGVISAQAGSLHPTVPEAEFEATGSSCDAAAAGFESAWLWTPRAITTVEIACLKMSCSWLPVSRTTEYLSKDRIRPVSFTPLTR